MKYFQVRLISCQWVKFCQLIQKNSKHWVSLHLRDSRMVVHFLWRRDSIPWNNKFFFFFSPVGVGEIVECFVVIFLKSLFLSVLFDYLWCMEDLGPVWFTLNSKLNSQISFLITQTQFSYLISLSLLFP